MRPYNFDELLEVARKRPMLPEALKQLGVEIKKVGHGKGGAIRWQTTTQGGRADDLSSVVFFENPDGTWIAIDNKQRTGKQKLPALNVLTDLFGISFKDAVYMLSGGSPSAPPKTVVAPVPRMPAEPAPEIPFVEPPKANTAKHAAAYLTKNRLIPSPVVSKLLHLGAIYETYRRTPSGKEMPLLVFPILDENRKTVGADCCGAYSDMRYKHIVAGSDKRYGWRISNYVSEITKDTKLYFCESAIDAISLYCLTDAPGVYISMCGVKDSTFLHMAEMLGGTPVICTDNDEAGNNFRLKYPNCETMKPEIGKDWNDELKHRVTHDLDFALKPQSAPAARAAAAL